MQLRALRITAKALMAAFMILPLLTATLSYSADDDEKEKKYANVKTKQRHAVGQKCGKALERIPELVEQEAWKEAEQVLKDAKGSTCATSYEISQVWNYLGFIYYSLDNIPEAIKAYNNAINEPEADERQRVSTLYTMAQLYFVVEDYTAAAKTLETWMKESEIVGSDAKVLLAQAYYQLDRKDDSLRLVEEALADEEAKGNVPKEGWWSLQRILYYEKKDYNKVIDILKLLITNYPKFTYWSQLGGMYGEVEQDMNRLVAMDVTYLGGDLTEERKLLGLGYMYLGAEVPFMAAKVIEKGMKDGIISRSAKNLELLGTAWQQGEDAKKALPVLEEAAKKADEGNIYARLAGVYLDLGQNAKSVAAAKNAIRKGGVKREDLVYLNLGSAQISLYCYVDAVKSFRKAIKDERSAKFAKQWIEYAEREGDRREKLRESGAKLEGCQQS